MSERAALLSYARSVLGTVEAEADRSWGHGAAVVLELVDADGTGWILKQPRAWREYERERVAYLQWVPALGAAAPRLAAYDDGRQTLVLSALPDTPADGTDPEIQRQAGVLLRRFHDCEPSEPWPDFAAYMAERLEDHLAIGAGLFSTAELAAVRGRVAELVGLPTPPRGPCHLDYQPRNWLVHEGTLHVIDFGMARRDTWARDLNRLYFRDWQARPELQEAFLAGYGRALDGDALELLLCCGAHAAVTTIVWARRHGEVALEAHGRRMLRSLGLS